MIHVYDFNTSETASPWTAAWGRMVAMVQGNWDENPDTYIWLLIRLRGEDTSQTPITRVGIDLEGYLHSPRQTLFSLNKIGTTANEQSANFFACDALEGCHYDFRWLRNDELTDDMALQGIVKTFSQLPSYLQ